MLDPQAILSDRRQLHSYLLSFTRSLSVPTGKFSLPYIQVPYGPLGVAMTESECLTLSPSMQQEVLTRLDNGLNAVLAQAIEHVAKNIKYADNSEDNAVGRLTHFALAFFLLMMDKEIFLTNEEMLRMPAVNMNALNPSERPDMLSHVRQHIAYICRMFLEQYVTKSGGKEGWNADKALVPTFSPTAADVKMMDDMVKVQVTDPGKPDFKFDLDTWAPQGVGN